MRGRHFIRPATLRALGVLGLAAGLVAGAAAIRHCAPVAAQFVPAAGSVGTPDSLDTELHRCHRLGMAALQDSACQTAWAANRTRFFSDTPSRPLPAVAVPAIPATPAEDR